MRVVKTPSRAEGIRGFSIFRDEGFMPRSMIPREVRCTISRENPGNGLIS